LREVPSQVAFLLEFDSEPAVFEVAASGVEVRGTTVDGVCVGYRDTGRVDVAVFETDAPREAVVALLDRHLAKGDGWVRDGALWKHERAGSRDRLWVTSTTKGATKVTCELNDTRKRTKLL
jgi:hypothetical protein